MTTELIAQPKPSATTDNIPLEIIIDSREQLPFTFDGLPVRTVVQKLDAGDYGLVDLPGCVVERKAPGDLLNCIGGSRDRFVRELERLQELDFSVVVVECGIKELFSGRHSQISPQSAQASLIAWEQRFPRTHWHFCPSRPWAEKLTYQILERFHRDSVEGKRTKNTAGM